MFKRIVQRACNGKYAVKRWDLFLADWEYRDTIYPNYWWPLNHKFNPRCWTDDYDLILKLFKDEEVIVKRK